MYLILWERFEEHTRAEFDSVTSNHVGLAEELHQKREAAGLHEHSILQHDNELLTAD